MTTPAAPSTPMAAEFQAIHRLADAFLAAKGEAVTDPDLCRGWCAEISTEFTEALAAEGITAQVIDGLDVGELPEFPGVKVLLNGHYATLVSLGDPETEGLDVDWVWDWTARQFDPDADCPLVQPLYEWRKRWRHPKSAW